MLKHSSNGAILVTCCSYACGVIIKADSMHSVIQFSGIPTYEFFQMLHMHMHFTDNTHLNNLIGLSGN